MCPSLKIHNKMINPVKNYSCIFKETKPNWQLVEQQRGEREKGGKEEEGGGRR